MKNGREQLPPPRNFFTYTDHHIKFHQYNPAEYLLSGIRSVTFISDPVVASI